MECKHTQKPGRRRGVVQCAFPTTHPRGADDLFHDNVHHEIDFHQHAIVRLAVSKLDQLCTSINTKRVCRKMRDQSVKKRV
jgi:hypothetical protein